MKHKAAPPESVSSKAKPSKAETPAVEPVAGHITPVPGGVGPMTIACLLRNTLTAAKRSAAKRQA